MLMFITAEYIQCVKYHRKSTSKPLTRYCLAGGIFSSSSFHTCKIKGRMKRPSIFFAPSTSRRLAASCSGIGFPLQSRKDLMLLQIHYFCDISELSLSLPRTFAMHWAADTYSLLYSFIGLGFHMTILAFAWRHRQNLFWCSLTSFTMKVSLLTSSSLRRMALLSASWNFAIINLAVLLHFLATTWSSRHITAISELPISVSGLHLHCLFKVRDACLFQPSQNYSPRAY